MSKLTASIVREYQAKANPKKITIREFKALGRELRDKFGLTAKEALDLLRNDNVLEILSNHEKEESPCQQQ